VPSIGIELTTKRPDVITKIDAIRTYKFHDQNRKLTSTDKHVDCTLKLEITVITIVKYYGMFIKVLK
jgi:hypothetical protein